MELLIVAFAVVFIIWIFSLIDPYHIVKILAIFAALVVIGFFIGLGINLAYADGPQCQQIGKLVCNDVIKTYESNSYNNIAIIQRAGVLADLYQRMDCSASELATCITDNLNISKSNFIVEEK